MELLSDELLIETLRAAIQYELDQEFIQMLQAELKRRQINSDQDALSKRKFA
ncbi:sporulation histidine kinase inhibitor Sda [Paenibacillus protaetiae]|uniref:Sporulation histidine kinase inhibitor Sda n=1 Tax=Paenibacillus protaetiae TaxID=2509456 RepID=A0A4P6F4V9_9BACL|nr:sporulation histidine kinase inhibitor Sda [Paenibacillus protaetiae]QAY68227.1 sporulation histidine kinase inhibitor Sda [Paenibacillus protaetiae]